MKSSNQSCKKCHATGVVRGFLPCPKCLGTGEIVYNAATDPSRPYKVISATVARHYSTDAIIGSREYVEEAFATYAEAFAAVSRANGDAHDEISFRVAFLVNGALVEAPEDTEKARIRAAAEHARLIAEDSGLPF